MDRHCSHRTVLPRHCRFWRLVKFRQANAGRRFEGTPDCAGSDRALHRRNAVPSAKLLAR